MSRQPGDQVVITGVGLATAAGYGLDEHWAQLQDDRLRQRQASDYRMAGFKAGSYLKDPRLLKAVSATDAIGLAALAGLQPCRASPLGSYEPARCGLYTGSPGPSTFDHEPYTAAMESARGSDGHISSTDFGRHCMTARPTTLLASLTNNVLCYGSLMYDIQGPNSNYASGALSGHIAVQAAAKRLQRGQLDYAAAGGFSAHTEAVHTAMFDQLGQLKKPQGGDYRITPYANGEGAGTVLADGGVFVALERRAGALARQAQILGTYCGAALRCDAQGPLGFQAKHSFYREVVLAALAAAGVEPADVGLVLGNASGLAALDACELDALRAVFSGLPQLPALGSVTPLVGNLMEGSGLLELGLVSRLMRRGQLPPAMAVAPAASGFGAAIAEKTSHALVLKATSWGEYSCLVIQKEDL